MFTWTEIQTRGESENCLKIREEKMRCDWKSGGYYLLSGYKEEGREQKEGHKHKFPPSRTLQ